MRATPWRPLGDSVAHTGNCALGNASILTHALPPHRKTRAYMDFPCSSREELLELDMLGKRLHGISSIKVYSPEFHAISCVSKMDVQHVGALTKTISSKLDQCQVILYAHVPTC